MSSRFSSQGSLPPISIAMSPWLAFSFLFFFSSRRRHTRFDCDWSSDVCSSDLVQPGTHGAQLLADAQLLGLEVLDFLLLLGCDDERGLLAALGPQRGELVFGFAQLLLELLLFRPEALICRTPQFFHALERSRERGAAAHADEVGAAGEIVERVLNEIAVARPRLRDTLAEEALLTHPQIIGQQVGVGEHDQTERSCGFLQGALAGGQGHARP